MELFTFERAADYRRAMLRRYAHAPHFRDNKSAVFDLVSDRRGAFYRNSTQRMIGVRDGGAVLCQCVLVKHTRSDALTVAFFEAAEGATQAVAQMLTYAADYAGQVGAERILVAVDGHCNYSLGLSHGTPTRPPLFGECRNPDFYHAFFQQGYRRLGFSCFSGGFDAICARALALEARLTPRLAGIGTRCVDLTDFRAELRRYTDLSNAAFRDHWYYSHRDHAEDAALFRAMRPLLSPCNLIFAVKGGVDIGYVLLYPDFNALVPPGGTAGVGTFVQHKLLRRTPPVIKIVEMAVLPEHRASGAILALFAEACRQVRRCYPGAQTVVSSWIADDNAASRNTTTRFAPDLFGRYSVYEKLP